MSLEELKMVIQNAFGSGAISELGLGLAPNILWPGVKGKVSLTSIFYKTLAVQSYFNAGNRTPSSMALKSRTSLRGAWWQGEGKADCFIGIRSE